MDLELNQILQGTFSLIFVVVAIIIAILIIRRYIQYKSPEHLYVGLAWIGLAGPWFADAVVLPAILIGNLINPAVSAANYVPITLVVSLITTYYAPLAIMFWILAFTKLLRLENRKKVVILFGAIFIIFEILMIIFPFIDFNYYIGTYNGPFDYDWGLITTIFYLSAIFTALVSGLLFAYRAYKAENPESNLRGKFLIISFIAFAVGSLIPYVWTDISGLVVSRIILVFVVIMFYFGLNMPNFVKSLILK
ncbi:MAG: hypothetical protein GF311_05720 [Candidatus Lokiarchaeota archaeon]|nr:hypothetical protein [Candidatus Lokiarchaeota archaeon]